MELVIWSIELSGPPGGAPLFIRPGDWHLGREPVFMSESVRTFRNGVAFLTRHDIVA